MPLRGARCTTLLAFLLWSAVAALLPAHALEAHRIADGVYAFIGHRGDVSPHNAGNIGNSGFIIGPDGVVVIDTGPSFRHGQTMLGEIRRVAHKPVQAVILTHAVQEFVFGTAAFQAAGIDLMSHARTAELMRERCGTCLEHLRTALGEVAMQGTRLIIPSRLITHAGIRELAGRQLAFIHPGWACTPGDLAVLDRRTGVLFAGGLVSNRRVPLLRDGDFDGWVRALHGLKDLPARYVVPGHGPVGGIELIDMTLGYLLALDREVRSFYDRGATLTETVDGVELPVYAGWDMYPTLHRQNALHRYLQLEKDELAR